MKIVLTSTNIAKINATKNIFSKIYTDYNLETISVDSNVSSTPLNDNEGIEGAIHRIENAKKVLPNRDMYVGLEGIITKNEYGSFICGWAVIEVIKNGRRGFGCSSKVMLPEFISQYIESFAELSDLVKNKYPSGLIEKMDEIGTNGVITQEMYSRSREFEDALLCAIGYILNDTNFNSQNFDDSNHRRNT